MCLAARPLHVLAFLVSLRGCSAAPAGPTAAHEDTTAIVQTVVRAHDLDSLSVEGNGSTAAATVACNWDQNAPCPALGANNVVLRPWQVKLAWEKMDNFFDYGTWDGSSYVPCDGGCGDSGIGNSGKGILHASSTQNGYLSGIKSFADCLDKCKTTRDCAVVQYHEMWHPYKWTRGHCWGNADGFGASIQGNNDAYGLGGAGGSGTDRGSIQMARLVTRVSCKNYMCSGHYTNKAGLTNEECNAGAGEQCDTLCCDEMGETLRFGGSQPGQFPPGWTYCGAADADTCDCNSFSWGLEKSMGHAGCTTISKQVLLDVDGKDAIDWRGNPYGYNDKWDAEDQPVTLHFCEEVQLQQVIFIATGTGKPLGLNENVPSRHMYKDMDTGNWTESDAVGFGKLGAGACDVASDQGSARPSPDPTSMHFIFNSASQKSKHWKIGPVSPGKQPAGFQVTIGVIPTPAPTPPPATTQEPGVGAQSAGSDSTMGAQSAAGETGPLSVGGATPAPTPAPVIGAQSAGTEKGLDEWMYGETYADDADVAAQSVQSVGEVEEESSVSCFPGDSFVQIIGRGDVRITDTQVGDLVLAKSGRYEPLLGFLHAIRSRSAEFLTVVHSFGQFQASANHIVFANGGDKFVANVQVGDHLFVADGKSMVLSVRQSLESQGMFAPLTASGTIVVDGVLASNYATSSATQRLPHVVAHVALFPARMYHGLWGLLGYYKKANVEQTHPFLRLLIFAHEGPLSGLISWNMA